MPFSSLIDVQAYANPSNEIRMVKFKGETPLAVGDYLFAIPNYGTIYSAEAGANAVSWEEDAHSSSPLIGTLNAADTGYEVDLDYANKRTGWIRISDSGITKYIKVTQYGILRLPGLISAPFHVSSAFKILEFGGYKEVDFVFSDLAMIFRENEVITTIEFLNYGETSVSGINIGVDGTYIEANFDLTPADVSYLGGDSIRLTLTIRENHSGGAIIHSSSDETATAGTLAVAYSLPHAEVPNTTAFVNVLLSIEPLSIEPGD